MVNQRINNIRELNKRRVLEYVISHQPTSRVAISQAIKLTKATVSAIVSQLIEESYLLESQLFESTGGRKPTMIIINKCSYHIVAINYSRGTINGALVNLMGEILVQKIVKTIDEKNFDKTLEQTYSLIDSLLKKLSDVRTFHGISISIDGSVNQDSTIKLAHAKKWKNINLNQYMEDRYKVKSYTNNEANLAALGENCFFRQKENMAVISMHTGVGMGIISKFDLIKGYNGLAGEIGHTIVNVNGTPCSCGNNGCIEQYTSVSSLVDKVREVKNQRVTLKDIIYLYENSDSEVIPLMNEYCKYLGILITNAINLINPDELIISNEILDFLPELLQTSLKYVNLTVSSCNSIRLSSSKDIELLGAAVVAIRDHLSIRYYFPNKKK